MSLLIKMVLFYAPATYLQAYCTLTLLSVSFDRKRLAFFALIQGILLTVIRDIFNLFGPHTAILAVTYVLLVKYLVGVSFVAALASRTIGMFLVMIGEVYITKNLLEIWNRSLEQVFDNALLHVGLGWISNLVVVVTLIGVIAARTLWRKNKERRISAANSEGQ